MGLIRRATLWLVGALIILVVGVLSFGLVFPTRAYFNFDYRGRHYEASFVTLMKLRLCDFKSCIVRWAPGRDRTSLSLADGSLLILAPEPPFSWNNQYLLSGGVFAPRARWAWLNSVSNPTEIVQGNVKSRTSINGSNEAPFTSLVIDVQVQRISATALIEAIVSDYRPNEADRIVGSHWNAFQDPIRSGQLFVDVQIVAVQGEGVTKIRGSSAWVELDGGCRILFRPIKGEPNIGRVIGDFPQAHLLLRRGDLWSADVGPRPGEETVMYSAGVQNALTSGLDNSASGPVLREIHRIELHGKTCVIIEWPSDARGAYLDLGDGQIFSLAPSLSWVMLRN